MVVREIVGGEDWGILFPPSLAPMHYLKIAKFLYSYYLLGYSCQILLNTQYILAREIAYFSPYLHRLCMEKSFDLSDRPLIMSVYYQALDNGNYRALDNTNYRAMDNAMSVSGSGVAAVSADPAAHSGAGGMMSSGSFLANNLYHPGSGYQLHGNQCPQGIDDGLALMFVTMSSAVGMYVLWRQYSSNSTNNRLENPLELQLLRKRREIITGELFMCQEALGNGGIQLLSSYYLHDEKHNFAVISRSDVLSKTVVTLNNVFETQGFN